MHNIIETLAADWVASGDVRTTQCINHGYCADFATDVWKATGADIAGVYDPEDLEGLAGGCSDQFKKAVEEQLIGHTAIFHDGKYYDSESPEGVTRFEELPVNQRAMN